MYVRVPPSSVSLLMRISGCPHVLDNKWANFKYILEELITGFKKIMGFQLPKILVFSNLDIVFEGLGEMFEGDSVDTCRRKFPLVLMGG